MTYLDTNVLVRMITGDLPEVARDAYRTIERSASKEFVILDAVLTELTFILQYHEYKMSKRDISKAIKTLAGRSQICVSSDAIDALSLYAANPKLDFTDCLLAVKAKMKQKALFTLDKDLLKALD